MATRKPLVLLDNLKTGELPVGDDLGLGSTQKTANFTSAAIAGAPVYVDGAGSVDLANGAASGSSKVVGLADAAAAGGGAPSTYQYSGPLTLTTGEWDAVAGTTGGLTAGLCYFLSDATPGRLLEEGSTSGITTGDSVVNVGYAVSATELMLEIEKPILRS